MCMDTYYEFILNISFESPMETDLPSIAVLFLECLKESLNSH